MEVNGQVHTSATLLLGKEIPVLIEEARAGLDVWKNRHLLVLTGSAKHFLSFPACRLDTQ
jgi:hypothetical protein